MREGAVGKVSLELLVVAHPDPISLGASLAARCFAFPATQITSLSLARALSPVLSLFCKAIGLLQVAKLQVASQLVAASFIHSLTVLAASLSVSPSVCRSVRPPVCSSALPAWLRFCVFLSEKLSGCHCLTTTSCCSFVSAYRASLAYNFYLLLIQLQNCSLIAHIS